MYIIKVSFSVNKQLRPNKKAKQIRKHINNIFTIKSNKAKKQQRKTQNNKNKNLNSQTTKKQINKQKHKSTPKQINKSSRIINNTQKLILKIIILGKNKLQKNTSNYKNKSNII